MKLSRKLFSATAALGLAVLATVGSTYAWFSMNTDVTATGMQVTTQVGDNLFISGDTTESHFEIGYHDVVSGILEPVSTIDGENFFYNSTKNAKGDGSAKNASYTLYNASTAGASGYANAFSQNYGVRSPNEAKAYVEDTYYLKATPSANSTNVFLNLTRCNLTYQGDEVTEKAWRVAMFATYAQETTSAASSADVNLISIMAPGGATYFTSTPSASAVAPEYAEGHEGDPDHMQSSSTVVSAVSSLNVAPAIPSHIITATEPEVTYTDELTKAQTLYFKVVIRLWLEGEDTDCNNDTFASLTKDYRLDLKFDLESSKATGSFNISSGASARVTLDGSSAKVVLSNDTTGTITNGETPASYQWYDAEDDTSLVGETTYTHALGADEVAYCLVTTTKGNVYRTPNISLA